MGNKSNKNPRNNLFKDKFNRKVIFKGPDWFHDPSGEELEIIEVKEDESQNNK